MGASENNSAKPRVRPIVRLGIFLISHSNIVRYYYYYYYYYYY